MQRLTRLPDEGSEAKEVKVQNLELRLPASNTRSADFLASRLTDTSWKVFHILTIKAELRRQLPLGSAFSFFGALAPPNAPSVFTIEVDIYPIPMSTSQIHSFIPYVDSSSAAAPLDHKAHPDIELDSYPSLLAQELSDDAKDPARVALFDFIRAKAKEEGHPQAHQIKNTCIVATLRTLEMSTTLTPSLEFRKE